MGLFRTQRSFSRAKSRFLPIFNQQAAYVKQASSALYKLATSSDQSEWLHCEREIKQCELKGDAMLSEFYEAFYDSLTPLLDRDDLQVVSMQIDDFLDQINSSAKSVLLYMPDTIAPQLVDMAEYIDQEAGAIQSIVTAMEDIKANFSTISLQCERITSLEHAADEVYEEYIGELFRNEENAISLMKNKNMAEVFEATTDSAKTFSDHIRKLLLRYL